MIVFAHHTGSWVGTNEFRLMPDDPTHAAGAAAQVSRAAGGQVATIGYTWQHPEDGEQDGILLLGPDDDAEGVVALWGDSWHQSPAPKLLTGTTDGRRVQLDYRYGGDWRWQISIDATDPEALSVQMDNVVPPSAAGDGASGPYPAMVARFRRA
jgi:hypothetical protein